MEYTPGINDQYELIFLDESKMEKIPLKCTIWM